MQTEKVRTKKNIVYQMIFFALSLSILFIESIFILLSALRKGAVKKEVLSKKSKAGVDLKIIIK